LDRDIRSNVIIKAKYEVVGLLLYPCQNVLYLFTGFLLSYINEVIDIPVIIKIAHEINMIAQP
jgi:hypothetical protein